MLFGFDPVSWVRQKVLKYDPNQNGIPEVIEDLDKAEAGLAAVADFAEGFDVTKIEVILSIFNCFRLPEERQTPEEIAALAGKVVMIPIALRSAKAGLDKLEASLQEKP